MEIVLIRHGATAGNIEKRYIGTTDEPLCDTGTAQIHEYMSDRCYPQVQALYVSPLKDAGRQQHLYILTRSR